MRTQNRTAQTQRSNASSLHKKTFKVLRELYPNFTIQEETALDVEAGGRPTKVFVDLIVKELNLAIECHGRQHYEFTAHFHGTQTAFAQSQQRDEAKRQAILDARMSFLVIRFDEEAKLTPHWLITQITKAIKEIPE